MNNISVYPNDENIYLTVRQILDNYGLQNLPYYRFKQWWDLPSSKPIEFSGYITLESILEDYYHNDIGDDADIDFSCHEQALIVIIKKYYLFDNKAMFNRISDVIGYPVPLAKQQKFIDSVDFFINLNDVHADVQHQLHFSPYNMSSRLSKQLIADVLKCLPHADL